MENEIQPQSEKIIIIPDVLEDRYSSFRLIPWWDQAKLSNAVVLVAGAGALGNEVIKNLALLGVGNLVIVDMDVVETSNLSRSILFHSDDMGKYKAEVAAKRARLINPDIKTKAIIGRIEREVGLGIYRNVNVVISCLDNRESRLYINRACWNVGTPWIDGAISEMMGEARIFWPNRGPCYECTFTAADYALLSLRYSCSILPRSAMMEGKIPTTPTMASIIGGLEAQEALKIIHGMDVKPGTALVFNGADYQAYPTQYKFNENCLSHESFGKIVEFPDLRSEDVTVKEMLSLVRSYLGENAVLELGYDLVISLDCPNGHDTGEILRPVSEIFEDQISCPFCGSDRIPMVTHNVDGDETFLGRKLFEIGVPKFHILSGHLGNDTIHIELTGDKKYFLNFQ